MTRKRKTTQANAPEETPTPAEETITITSTDGTTQTLTGFRRRLHYVERTYTPPGAEEGEEPLTVKVPRSLTFHQMDQIPTNREAPFREVWEAIAGYVQAWNVVRENHLTGELEPVPPPAEAGPEAFAVLGMEETLWLAHVIKFGPGAIRTVRPPAEPAETAQDTATDTAA